jgi:hypothetical protein
VVVLAVLASLIGWQAAIAAESRESLRGLTGVYVLVESLSEEAERDGLSRNQLQTEVELRLKQAGINVQSEEEAINSPGTPYLYVSVSEYKGRDIPVYAFCVDLQLNQGVQLERNLATRLRVSTWAVPGHVGMVGVGKLRTVRKTVADQVDKFISNYLAVNPK